MRMAEQWFVRVHGKEYGPVDFSTLREWQAEGRLIPENEVRAGADSAWITAADVPELFGTPPPLPVTAGPAAHQPRTLAQIIADSFAVYFRGFGTFIVLALLFGIPLFLTKVALAFVQMHPDTGFAGTPPAAIAAAVVLLPILVGTWLVFVAGVQYATADVAAGKKPQLGAVLRRVRSSWKRVASAGAFVYGSYIFWTLPLLAVLAIAGQQPSGAARFIALGALALLLYMAARLFINFLFWQQACTIGELEATEALRESQELARSQPAAPRLQRPFYRGAILVAVWLVALLACSTAAELPFMMLRLQGVTTMEEMRAVVEQVANAPAPDRIALATAAVSNLVYTVLRPLLGISFLLLYFDTKARLS